MPAIELSTEQLQLVKIINDHALRFPNTEIGEADLLQSCYDYMDAFKRVMDSTSRIQMDYLCQQYDGFYRFAKLMESLACGTRLNLLRNFNLVKILALLLMASLRLPGITESKFLTLSNKDRIIQIPI